MDFWAGLLPLTGFFESGFAPDFSSALSVTSRRHDLIAIPIIDPREEDLPDVGLLTLEDAETGEQNWKGGRYGNGQLVLLPDQDLLLVTAEDGELTKPAKVGADVQVDVRHRARPEVSAGILRPLSPLVVLVGFVAQPEFNAQRHVRIAAVAERYVLKRRRRRGIILRVADGRRWRQRRLRLGLPASRCPAFCG